MIQFCDCCGQEISLEILNYAFILKNKKKVYLTYKETKDKIKENKEKKDKIKNG